MRLKIILTATLLLCGLSECQAQSQEEIDRIANTMVRLCVGGGSTSATGGSGSAGADLSLRSMDITGKLNGEFRIDRKSAEGLVEGLNSAISAVAADQADKVRACLQPVRDRLLDMMLPQKKSAKPPDEGGFDSVNSVIKKFVNFGLGETHRGEAKGNWARFDCDCLSGDFWWYVYGFRGQKRTTVTYLASRSNIVEGIILHNNYSEDVAKRVLLTLYASLRGQWGDTAKIQIKRYDATGLERDELQVFNGVRYHYQRDEHGEAIYIAR